MIKQLKQKSEFSRSVLTLITGTALAQALPIAIAPILTRLYTPEDFGLLALFLAIFSVLNTMATGRYEMAIMAPLYDSEAKSLVLLSIFFAFGICVLTGLPIFLFSKEIANFLGNEAIEMWLYFLPITVFFSGVYQSIDYWLNRQKKYRRMAKNKLLQAGGVSLAQMIVGLVSGAGLIIGNVIGRSLSSLLIIKKSKLSISHCSFYEIKRLAFRYRDYPLFQAPFSVLNSLSSQAPIFFVAKFFDASIVGLFSMVIKILSAPAALIAKSIGQVYFQRVSEHAKSSPELLLNDISRLALKLLMIAVLVFSPVLFYGREIFAFIFGNDWAQAGGYAQVLVFAVAIKFVVSPLSVVFLAIDKIRVGSFWQLVYFFTTIVMLYIALTFEFEVFLWIYVVHEFILYAIYFSLMIYSVRSYAALK